MYTIDRNSFLEKIYKQPGLLPDDIYKIIDSLQLEIVLYGLTDLDLVHNQMIFANNWIVLTKSSLLVFKKNSVHSSWKLSANISLTLLTRVIELNNMNLTTLKLISNDDSPALATLRYTRRQKVCIDNIKCFLNKKIQKQNIHINGKADYDNDYAHSVLKNYIAKQNSDTQKKSATLWRLLGYLRPYKKSVLLGGVGAVSATIINLTPAFLSGYLIDNVIKPFQAGQLEIHHAKNMAWQMVLTISLLGIAREFFIWLRLNKMAIVGEWVAKDLREKLYAHLQKLGLDFYAQKQTGSIITRVSSDSERIWDFVALGVVEVGTALMTLCGLCTVLIYLDLKLGLVMSLPVPFLLYGIYLHGEKMQKLFIRAWKKWSDLTNVLSDTIPGVQVVKAFGQEKKEARRFNEKNLISTREFNGIHRQWTTFWPLFMLIIHSVLMLTWGLAISRLLSPEDSPNYLSVGTFISFLLYMTMFIQPIEIIGQMSRMLNRALSSAFRIFEVLDTRPSMNEQKDAQVVDTIEGTVEFKNVQFSYDGVREILKDVSFLVRPGEMIGLVGQSGGGKSTITKLIGRFFDITKGAILIDGKNISEYERSSLRRNIGMVLQDPYLFHGSLLDNIRYGRPTASLAEVIEVAKASNAHEFIMKFPHAYQTTVGERGHTLSGGERQRISIARALLNDPKILILDEATSAVDTETERKIQDALDKLVIGRTVFSVAHRLSTLRQANRIFVVEDGKIIEEGKHAALLQKENGAYKKLYNLQDELTTGKKRPERRGDK